MHESRLRRLPADPNQARRAPTLLERPDRFAFWAVVLAIVAMIAAAASAHASSSGGIGGGSGGGGNSGGAVEEPTSEGCANKQLGRRTLRLGDCGDDVTTLNWILKSKDYAAPLIAQFNSATAAAVRAFQENAALRPNGVVDPSTTEALVRSMPSQLATWYGPGFFGNTTACGQTLTRSTVGVAHRKLPCGSKVVVRYEGRFLRTTVIDRGPFANGAYWDLTQAAAQRLGFEYTDEIRVAKIAAR